MRNRLLIIACILFLGISIKSACSAAYITNGDFSLNYTGWTREQNDTYYSNSTFFKILGTTNPYAQVSIDLDLNGDGITDTNAIACDLYQAPDFSAPPGSKLTLSFDWLFDGDPTINPILDNDTFNVFFDDGSGATYDAKGISDFLVQTYTYSPTWKHFCTDVSYYLNTPNTYYLTFQLESSFGSNGNNYWASHFCLDNVQITVTSPSSTVPEPSTVFLLVNGLLGVYVFIRKNRLNTNI